MGFPRCKPWTAAILLLPASLALSNGAGSSLPAATQKSEYVDPGVCAACHQDVAKSYLDTGMGRSFSRPDARQLKGALAHGSDLYNQASDLHYSLLLRDGTLLERRWEQGAHGEKANTAERAADYVIGSGNHARTFLHRDAQGRLVELPVSWYAEAGGSFAMSPGYDRRDQEDFRRAVPAECLFCHNGYALSKPKRTSMDPPPFPATLPQGIDCQRCHGPGSAHVRAAASGAGVEAIRAAIVNPARLSRDRQMDVCMQCHLETSSSHMPNEIRRYGREVASYRPGEALGDYKLYFAPVPGDKREDRFEIVHAAYRLRQSACFQKSQMTCLTCHDPHRSSDAAGAEQRYTAICRSCHQSVDHQTRIAASSSCIGCHMPKRRTEDAVHVVMTDHWIQRRKPERDLLAPIAEQPETTGPSRGVTLYYPPALPPTATNQLYLDVAAVKDGAGGTAAVERLRGAVEKATPAQAEFYFELGHAYSKGGQGRTAERWFSEALRRQADYPAASKELAALLLRRGAAQEAAAVLEKAVSLAPDDDALAANLGNVYLRERRIDRAEEMLQKAIRLNSDLAEAANLMGLIAVQQKSSEQAEMWFRKAVENDPAMAEARENLGRSLAARKDYEEAVYQYRRAINAAPADAAAHHGYAQMLEMTQAWDAALAELRESVRLDPRAPQTHNDLADLLGARGEQQEAAAEYRRALALDPGMQEARLSLASLLAGAGKLVEAEAEYRTALRGNASLDEAHLGLALVLAAEGKRAEAAAECRSAAQSADGEIRRSAAELLARLANSG